MIDSEFLLNYTKFVDSVTSKESKEPDAFNAALDKIDKSGVSPQRFLTVALGLGSESAEIIELVKHCVFQGKPLDDHTKYHMKRELGDVLWYIIQGCITLDCSLEELIKMNIEKLEKRYPNGFSAVCSNNRAEGDI